MEHAVNELVKLNDLKDPNKLDVGQEVELQSVAVLGIQPLFLDKDRNLVSVLEYILEYCNKQSIPVWSTYPQACSTLQRFNAWSTLNRYPWSDLNRCQQGLGG